MQTSGQHHDAKGLTARLRQALGPGAVVAQSPLALFEMSAEQLPGLYIQVAPDGTILSMSKEFALALGAGDPASLTAQSIANCLPELAPGSPLNLEILKSGEVRNAPVALHALVEGVCLPAFVSARAITGTGLAPGAWMGCLTLSPAQDQRCTPRAGFGPELLEGLRVELRSHLAPLTGHTLFRGGNAPNGLNSMDEMCLEFLPGLEALRQLDIPSSVQTFDARASMWDLCRTTGRLLDNVGVNLIFDADPACPNWVRADEHRLGTCLNLLLGLVYATERPAEIVVSLMSQEAGFLRIEVAGGAPGSIPATAQRCTELELCRLLASTADGTVSMDEDSPESRTYTLRMRAPAEPETGTATESGSGAGAMIDRSLQGLRVLFVGPGEAWKPICTKWMERQQAVCLYASTSTEASAVCNGTQPDVAVVDLSLCHGLPEFLRSVPVLGLRGSSTPAPRWCGNSIEKPICEPDLLAAIGPLIPLTRPEDSEPRGSAPCGGARILAVDDNPVNLRLLHKALVKLGHSVDLASNGQEALDAIMHRPYDVVLMDWEMPVMDGLEATEAIRKLPEPLCRIPIIAVTAHALLGDRETCLRAGMDDYLSKPVRVEALNKMLEAWLHCSPRLLNLPG